MPVKRWKWVAQMFNLVRFTFYKTEREKSQDTKMEQIIEK